MAIRELAPCLGIINAPWERVENQTALFSNQGEADVLNLGDQFWNFEATYEIRERAQFDDIDAFLARRNLSAYSFTMWRPLRPNPRDRLITSDAGLTLAAIDVANSELDFTGFGPGRTAHPGDMISYRTLANGYWVGQVTGERTADGSGVVSVPVWPLPVTKHASSPSPKRIKALGEFRLIEEPKIDERFKRWSVKFKAEQVLI